MTATDKKDMSKKSEKLEIRLSYEDKQKLAAVADTEGRTVSDLVRGLIRRYIQTTSARLPQKRPWLIWAGMGIIGMLIGHIGTWAYTQSHHHHAPRIYDLTVRMDDGSLTTPILAQDDYMTDIVIASPNGDVIVNLSVIENDSALSVLKANICRQTNQNCEQIAAPILHFNPSRPAVININDGHSDEIYMVLSPPRQDAD